MSSTKNMGKNQIDEASSTESELGIKGRDFSSCILGTNYFTVIGVGMGTLLTIRSASRRNWRHFVILSFAGVITDLYYGYFFNCVKVKEDFEKAKFKYEAEKKLNADKEKNDIAEKIQQLPDKKESNKDNK